ncbi:uncharacterized protein BDR25DRAFT_166115, partial [Lindgomyces ingoldianus]
VSALTFVKMSITHLYISLFPQVWLRITCKFLLILQLMFWAGFVIAAFLTCRPFEYLWNKKLPGGGKCFDIHMFWLGGSIAALLFDLMCVGLPMPVLWGLKMGIAKKVKLTVMFGLGFLIVVITATRVYYVTILDFNDLTWSSPPAVIFTVLEAALAVLAGCLPVMNP